MTLETDLMGMPTWWWLQHLPSAAFLFCFGACVGSFLNVVIYRLPAGMSLSNPPSRCSTCGARLKFFRENLPIIGWFLVRGKCRYCGVPVSPQYMFVELLMAFVFLGLYAMFYMAGNYTPWFGELAGPWWHDNGIVFTWPALIAYAFLIAGIFAMTVIDARTFTIPMPIPLFVTFAAFIAWPLQALLVRKLPPTQPWPIPLVGWTVVLMSGGAMLGLLISHLRLRLGRIKPSFADYSDYLPSQAGGDAAGSSGDWRVSASELVFLLPCLFGLVVATLWGWWIGILAGVATAVVASVLGRLTTGDAGEPTHPSGDDVLAPDYPHARREMLVELCYLLPCLAGLAAGWLIGKLMPAGNPPLILQAIGASFCGYLMGGGLVWGIRILGTLGFGREAMGLGDVHLLGAVGAVLGWFDPILIFFIAPFSGLAWAFGSMALTSVLKKIRRELPYGPHLAVATLAVMLCRPGIHEAWRKYFNQVPWPNPTFVPPSPLPQRNPPSHPGPRPATPTRPGSGAATQASSQPATTAP